MAASVAQDFELGVCFRLVVTENVIAESEVFVGELVGWETLVVLNLEVAVNWLGKLNQR